MSSNVLHNPAFYDLTVWLATFGRERVFREKVLSLVAPVPGEAILDIGCGTGTLAIAAKSRLGNTGSVDAIDASPEMLARAARKARRASVAVTFTTAFAEALPFPDARFDAVLSTVMLHHLPRNVRVAALREAQRVLKPQGRLLAVDFAAGARSGRGLFARLRHRHGYVKAEELAAAILESGLRIERSGELGFGDMHFVLARRVAC